MKREKSKAPPPPDKTVESTQQAHAASDVQTETGEAQPPAPEDERVTLPKAEFEALMDELNQLRNQVKEFSDGWARERADFSNYRKRIERDQMLQAQMIKGEIIKKYLVILDDLGRALKAKPSGTDSASWANGIELISQKLTNILEAEGIKRIEAEKEDFDPTRHEAITHEDSPTHNSGQIIEVVQEGYTLGDRVIRPALVRVAR